MDIHIQNLLINPQNAYWLKDYQSIIGIIFSCFISIGAMWWSNKQNEKRWLNEGYLKRRQEIEFELLKLKTNDFIIKQKQALQPFMHQTYITAKNLRTYYSELLEEATKFSDLFYLFLLLIPEKQKIKFKKYQHDIKNLVIFWQINKNMPLNTFINKDIIPEFKEDFNCVEETIKFSNPNVGTSYYKMLSNRLIFDNKIKAIFHNDVFEIDGTINIENFSSSLNDSIKNFYDELEKFIKE